MTLPTLGRPSFWSEPRDPWAWQRALKKLAVLDTIDDPRPTFEGPLRTVLSRRAVPGLYGFKAAPKPGAWLGCGLVVPSDRGWRLAPEAAAMVTAPRDDFQLVLAKWLVAHSAWVRLMLVRLQVGTWCLPQGMAPVLRRSALRIGRDLDVARTDLGATYPAAWLCGSDIGVATVRVHATPSELAPLHAPLFLLNNVGWLGDDGRPRLPAGVGAELVAESAARALTRITAEEADLAGFAPVARIGRRLWEVLGRGPIPRTLGGWVDESFGQAIARGAIEVEAWGPGQARHGRGLFGDRDKKLVRWRVHDDFEPIAWDSPGSRGDTP